MDLNDGMNREEAVVVASAIINHSLTNASYEVKLAQDDECGVWRVNFGWEYNSLRGITLPDGSVSEGLVLGHYFNVVICPQNRTVTYNRCM